MNSFAFTTPATVNEALEQLDEGAVFKAGGVDLLDMLKENLAAPKKLVNIRHIRGLDQVTADANGVRIGPMVTLTQLAEDRLIRERYIALAQAAARAATPQIRNMATAGGNLLQRPRCWYFRHEDFHCRKKGGTRCFAQDGENQYHAIFDNRTCAIIHPSAIAVPLIAFGAQIELTGAKGKRTVALEKFFVRPEDDIGRENSIGEGEMLTAILVPPATKDLQSAYFKQGEKESFDWPIADVAVVLHMEGNKCTKSAVVLGAAAPIPRRATEAEAKLNGADVNEALAREAANAAMQGATPLALNGYKIPVFKAVIRRTIMEAVKNKVEFQG